MLPYQPSQLAVDVDKETQIKEDVKPKIRNRKDWMDFLQKEIDSRLNLAYQDLDEVPEKVLRKYSSKIKSLDLSYNKIRAFNFLLDVPKLSTLILDHNGITSQVRFPCLLELHTLWLNHNNITNLVMIVKQLWSSFPNLQYLSMMNNEAAPSYFNGGSYDQYKDYRHYVISHLPKLLMLDDTPVTAEERGEAERIYTRMAMEPPARLSHGFNKKKSKVKKSSEITTTPEPTPQQIHQSLLDSLPSMEELTEDMARMESAVGDQDNTSLGQDNDVLRITQTRKTANGGFESKGESPHSDILQSNLIRDPIMDSLPDLSELDVSGTNTKESDSVRSDWSSS